MARDPKSSNIFSKQRSRAGLSGPRVLRHRRNPSWSAWERFKQWFSALVGSWFSPNLAINRRTHATRTAIPKINPQAARSKGGLSSLISLFSPTPKAPPKQNPKLAAEPIHGPALLTSASHPSRDDTAAISPGSSLPPHSCPTLSSVSSKMSTDSAKLTDHESISAGQPRAISFWYRNSAAAFFRTPAKVSAPDHTEAKIASEPPEIAAVYAPTQLRLRRQPSGYYLRVRQRNISPDV